MSFTVGQHVYCRTVWMLSHLGQHHEKEVWVPGVLTGFHDNGQTVWAMAKSEDGAWYGCITNVRTEDQHAALTLAT